MRTDPVAVKCETCSAAPGELCRDMRRPEATRLETHKKRRQAAREQDVTDGRRPKRRA